MEYDVSLDYPNGFAPLSLSQASRIAQEELMDRQIIELT
jgi:hypothetical protein